MNMMNIVNRRRRMSMSKVISLERQVDVIE